MNFKRLAGDWQRPGFWVAVVLYVAIAGSGLAADLITKARVFAAFWPYYQHPDDWSTSVQPHWVIDEVLGVQTSTNPGALFGMMAGYQSVFVVMSFLALSAVIAWLFAFGAWKDRLLLLCLSMITGGILGNLYDRMGWWHEALTPEKFQYQVRDWIHFRLQGVPFFDPWPNFNIADSLLVVGVILMLVQNLFFAAPPVDSVSSETGFAPADPTDEEM